MQHFVDNHRNKLDGKGRVSVPSQFRNVLRDMEAAPVLMLRPVKRPAYGKAYIEVCTLPEFEAKERQLEKYEEGSEARERKEREIYANATMVEVDKDGRILIPAKLVAQAGLGETVIFVGMGKRFHIWEEAAGEAFLADTVEAAA
jgi:MraZ protein